jgi:hypothetical protein
MEYCLLAEMICQLRFQIPGGGGRESAFRPIIAVNLPHICAEPSGTSFPILQHQIFLPVCRYLYLGYSAASLAARFLARDWS